MPTQIDLRLRQLPDPWIGRGTPSLPEIARHRFVYRSEDAIAYAEPVESRSMQQHLDRLVAGGRVREVEPGRFLAS